MLLSKVVVSYPAEKFLRGSCELWKGTGSSSGFFVAMEVASCVFRQGDDDYFVKVEIEKSHWIDLFIDHMLANRPCILTKSSTKSWKIREYLAKTVNGRSGACLEYLTENYGQFPLIRKILSFPAKEFNFCCLL